MRLISYDTRLTPRYAAALRVPRRLLIEGETSNVQGWSFVVGTDAATAAQPAQIPRSVIAATVAVPVRGQAAVQLGAEHGAADPDRERRPDP